MSLDEQGPFPNAYIARFTSEYPEREMSGEAVNFEIKHFVVKKETQSPCVHWPLFPHLLDAPLRQSDVRSPRGKSSLHATQHLSLRSRFFSY